MEETNYLEQPNSSAGVESVGEQNSQEEKVQPNVEENGSNFGKFKDSASLLSAYSNLEKEFTKKSQKLAELLKSEEIKNANLTEINENIDNNSANEEKCDNSIHAFYEDDNWKTYSENFIKSNPEAKKYSSEIYDLIASDKFLSSSPNCLEYAFAIVKQNHQVGTENLLTNQTFLNEHILNNENIKNQIIKNYLSSLSANVPRFISGTTQNISVTTPENKPKTIKDASDILRKLLN